MSFKKIFALGMVMLCIIGSVLPVSAGEICGEALNSDIITYINNYAVPTYIVSGTSVVVAEELREYGFDVLWDGEARILSISRNDVAEINPPTFFKPRKSTGSKYCDLYTTDIKTYAEGQIVTAYNMNGFTMIPVEELTMLGEVCWYGDERILKMTVPGVEEYPHLTGAYFRVFSEDGRNMDINVTELGVYREVGWYTADQLVDKKIEQLVANNGYATAVATMEADLKGLTDTFFREAYETGIDKLYGQWYRETGVPVAITACHVDFDTGYPRVNLSFRNISGRKVTSFKAGFEFMDSAQQVIPDSVTVATAKKVLEHGGTASGRWTVKKFPSAVGIVRPEIIRVEFEDGTVWSK